MAEMQFPPGQKQNVQSLKALDYPQAGGIVPRHPANDHNDGPRRVYMVYIYMDYRCRLLWVPTTVYGALIESLVMHLSNNGALIRHNAASVSRKSSVGW